MKTEKKKGMKTMAAFILAMTMLAPLAACGSPASSDLSDGKGSSQESASSSVASDSSAEDLTAYDLSAFDLQKYVSPVWKGRVSYAEAAFVMENPKGETEPIKLLYPIEKIVSVRSANLATKYEEGRDYEVTAEGELKILKEGNIPVLAYDKYYFETYTDDGLKTQIPSSQASGAYMVAETTKESAGMSAWCLAVTYTHSGKSPLSVPENKSERFSLLREKLSKGEPVKAVYYGDSITYGWGSTALAEVDRAPRCPGYCDLAMDYLESKYGSEISRVNLSKSGETSAWAKEYANYKKVCDENPDLVILAFGMNDGVVTEGSTFVANIKNIVKNIRARCPDAEIAVVTSMLPNEKVGYQQGTCLRNYHAVYPGLLAEAEEKWEGVGVADVTAAHTEILARKKFQDTTSSNTNHPNDFMHRIYAQVLLRTLLGEEF